MSFAEGKGEYREGRGGGKFRQEFYRNPNPSVLGNFLLFLIYNFVSTHITAKKETGDRNNKE